MANRLSLVVNELFVAILLKEVFLLFCINTVCRVGTIAGGTAYFKYFIPTRAISFNKIATNISFNKIDHQPPITRISRGRMFVSPNKNNDHLRKPLLVQASSLVEEYDVEAKNNKTPPPVDDADDEGTEGFQLLCERVAVFTFGTLCGMLYSFVKLYLLSATKDIVRPLISGAITCLITETALMKHVEMANLEL